MSTTTSPTGVTVETKKTTVKVASVAKGNFQREGTVTAELRQKVVRISHYPGMQVANEMQQNVFAADEFTAVKPQQFTSEETRVAWIDVPEGTTVKAVQDRIAKNACLYRVLSNAPILTSGHKNAINRGLTTKDVIADAQALRYPEGHEKSGQLILDSEGRVQYRKIFFYNELKEDEDLRGNVAEYRSAKINAELGSNSTATSVPAGEITLVEEWQ